MPYSSPGNGAYAELAISSAAVAVTLVSAHFAYPRRAVQAELRSSINRVLAAIVLLTYLYLEQPVTGVIDWFDQ